MYQMQIGPTHRHWKKECGNLLQVVIYDNAERAKIVEHFTGEDACAKASKYLKENALCQKEELCIQDLIPECQAVS